MFSVNDLLPINRERENVLDGPPAAACSVWPSMSAGLDWNKIRMERDGVADPTEYEEMALEETRAATNHFSNRLF